MKHVRILAAHPLRHHFLHTARGIAASGFDYAIAVPFRLGQRMFRLLSTALPGRLSTLRNYTYPGVDPDRIYLPSPGWPVALTRLASARKAVGYFDARCAHDIATDRLRADVLHVFQDYMPRTVAAARRRGSRIVVEQISNSSLQVRARAAQLAEQWGYPLERFGFSPEEKDNDEILHGATAAICPSRFIIEGVTGRIAGTIAHLPYGVDLSMFAPLTKPDPAQEFRLVARSTTIRKGLTITIEAVHRLVHSERFAKRGGLLRIDFLGEIEPLDAFRKQIVDLQTHPRVRWSTGHRDRNEVAALLGAAHALVLPSVSEGMSLAVMEAAACGTASIISPYCGQDDFVDGVHGLVLQELSASEVESAVWRMMSDRAALEAFGTAASEYAKGRDWAEFERGIAELYRELFTAR
jgi:glycosyltransferase involved in cell wall biosynthesis